MISERWKIFSVLHQISCHWSRVADVKRRTLESANVTDGGKMWRNTLKNTKIRDWQSISTRQMFKIDHMKQWMLVLLCRFKFWKVRFHTILQTWSLTLILSHVSPSDTITLVRDHQIALQKEAIKIYIGDTRSCRLLLRRQRNN